MLEYMHVVLLLFSLKKSNKLKETSQREKLTASAYITFSCLLSDTDLGKSKKQKIN